MNRSFIVSSGSATIHQEPVTEESVLSMLGGGQFGAEKAQCGLRSSSCQCYCLPSMRRRTRALEKSHGSCWGRWGGSLPELKSVVLTACPCFPSPPSHLPAIFPISGLFTGSWLSACVMMGKLMVREGLKRTRVPSVSLASRGEGEPSFLWQNSVRDERGYPAR